MAEPLRAVLDANLIVRAEDTTRAVVAELKHDERLRCRSRYNPAMRIIAGKVRGGVVVPSDSEGLIEGTDVGVVANDGESSFTAPPEDEAALLAALAEDAGTISSEELLSRLR